MIMTGSGYEAWGGCVQRHVVDFEVPGAIGGHGLKWERTYSSATGQWNFAYTWRVFGAPLGADSAMFPDGRQTRFRTGSKERLFQTGSKQQGGGTKELYLEDGSIVHCSWEYDYIIPGEPGVTTDYITPLWVTDRYGRKTLLGWDQYNAADPFQLRLSEVEDELSHHWIHITYAPTDPCADGGALVPISVEGSDGQWVHYCWSKFYYADQVNHTGPWIWFLNHVDYSDGTSADYTRGVATYWTETQVPPDYHIEHTTVPGPVMTMAQDTRAAGPMQSIAYEYYNPGHMQGQLLAEHHLDLPPGASPTPGVVVSSCTKNMGKFDINGVQTETRGDGPTRTIRMAKLSGTYQGRPFVTFKSDYNGVLESYGYNANYFLNSITDRNGNTTNFTLESMIGNPTKKTHPDATHIDYTYSDTMYPYYVATVTDENGKKTTYTRNSRLSAVNPNVIIRIDYPSDANTPASAETFAYNNFGQVLDHVRRNGAHEFAAYDTIGRLTDLWNPTLATSVTDSDPHTHFDYYGPNDPIAGNAWIDRVKTVTPPANSQGLVNVQTYEYDRTLVNGESTGTPCLGRGLVTNISYPNDKHNGAYPTGTYKSFAFDKFGNKKWEENELRQRTSYVPDDYKRLVSTTLPATTPIPNATTVLDYTATNGSSSYTHTTKSIRKTTGPATASAPGGIVMGQTYDNNLRVASRIQAQGVTGVQATTTLGYDANGNQTSLNDPRNYTTSTTYDNRNRKINSTNPLTQITRWAYDSVGNVLVATRTDNTTETKTYDAMNRVLTDKNPDQDPRNCMTTFTYDSAGTVHTVKDARSNLTTFTYDPFDLKTKMLYQNGDHQDYAYDADHNLTSRRTAAVANVYQVFTYDSRNRKLSMGWHNSADPNSADITWDNGIDKSLFDYDAASRLTFANNGFSTVTRIYDAAGRLYSDDQNLAATVHKNVQYDYDAATENTHLYVNDGNGYDRTFGYDPMGRFETIKNTLPLTPWFQYHYDLSSNETQRDCSLITNSMYQKYTRDALNRMSRRDLQIGTAPMFAYEAYGFDAMSRTTSIDREDVKRDAFGYYPAGEMNLAQYGLVNGINPTRTVNYTLDAVGNRTTVVDAGVSKTYVPDNINRYTIVGTENVITGPSHQIGSYQTNAYQYVGDSYVATINTPASYALGYDALGRCVKRTLNGVTTTYYVYDGEKPILEYTSTGSIAGNNVYGKGIDEILMRTDYPSGQTYYYQGDHEGSVTHLTNSAGGVIESYRYDAFGAPTIKNGSGTVIPATAFNNRFLFTGREYVSQFGIYEYRARTYHPGLGRFMSEDPKGFDAGDYNLFRYCKNDPEDFTDPTGEQGGAEGEEEAARDERIERIRMTNPEEARRTEAERGMREMSAPEAARAAEEAAMTVRLQLARDAMRLRQDFEKHIQRIEKQGEEHGEKALLKSLRSLQKNVDKEEENITKYKDAGGDTKAVENEIRAYKLEIARLKYVLDKTNNPKPSGQNPAPSPPPPPSSPPTSTK
jgi:RHS repeat-associated protein